jgi:hypothetical protein
MIVFFPLTYSSKKHPFDSLKEVYMFHQAWCHLEVDETMAYQEIMGNS